MLAMLRPEHYLNLEESDHAVLFEGQSRVWEALKSLKSYIDKHVSAERHHTTMGEPAFIGEHVSIGEGTVVEAGAVIKGPAIIGKNCQIRSNAYIREYVIIGDNCVVGNATEIKHSLLFNHAVAPHFNYIGDSILGFHAHMGAGVKISNFKLTQDSIFVDDVDHRGIPIDTGLRKLGAIIGDYAEVGCNAVLNPGSLLGRHSIVYPNVCWRGILPDNMIVKNRAKQDVVVLRPRDY
jgi:UDP-N-acetylglucosamine diphosphorylase / glucose-1-phosphate thymidylyltransferase / UDP-N-acetylgalactosamine diphosphorylase / glucosamine-1-phosphate N-acetyltransferase / galactosamine-1-phosphate N-acetyltransferase